MIVRGAPTEAARPHQPTVYGTLAWQTVPHMERGISSMHVVPINDLAAHQLTGECRCRPDEDAETPDMWIHKAWDGRERYADAKGYN
jgi:hypothetical protein